jgi:uncharacterized membrane protein
MINIDNISGLLSNESCATCKTLLTMAFSTIIRTTLNIILDFLMMLIMYETEMTSSLEHGMCSFLVMLLLHGAVSTTWLYKKIHN